MGLDLSEIARDPALHLHPVHIPDGLDSVTVHSVHVTDLSSPRRWLVPDELVVTNGLWLSRVSIDHWLDEVIGAGAIALAFGVDDPESSPDTLRACIPDDLISACEERGFPLLELRGTSTAVADAVSESIVQDARAELRRHAQHTNQLLSIVADGGEYVRLVEALGQITGFQSAVVGPSGNVLGRCGLDLNTESIRAGLAASRRQALSSEVGAGLSVFRTQGARTLLYVGATLSLLDAQERMIIDQVATCVALVDAMLRNRKERTVPITQELIDLARVGELTATGFEARLRALSLDSTDYIVAVAAPPPLELLQDSLEVVSLPYAAAQHGNTVIALVQTSTPEELSISLVDALRYVGEPILGLGSPAVGVDAVRRSIAQAVNAAFTALSRPAHERVVVHTEVSSHAILLDLLHPDTLRSFRQAVLAPVEDWDKRRGTDLIGTLRDFLESGGQWRSTAKRLHLHHNTLRHRIERIEELTGRSLSSTEDRVDLYLALSIPPSSEGSDPYNPWTPAATAHDRIDTRQVAGDD